MLFVVLLHGLFVLSSCSDLHDKVFRNLLRLCPEQYIPTDNGTAVNITSESASCCTDYYNKSTERMLYLNTTNYLEDGQSCLYPTTRLKSVNRRTKKSYYMITDAPEDGCVISDNPTAELANDNNQPTCNDSEITPFGRLLPTYSKSSGFIYKNPQCAFCHGQDELTDWKASASCHILAPFQYDLSMCHFQFVYPGPADDIQHLECFTDKFNSCPEKFAEDVNIPSNIDLSVQELAEACTMDELPRFENKVFSKNVFCYICHHCRSYVTCPLTECLPAPDSNDDRGRNTATFSRILDSRLINENMQARHQDENICGLESNMQICHEVMCPQGQVMTGDGKSRKCQMDSTKWIAEHTKFVMWLLLDFEDNMEINDVTLERILRREQVQNPWPASWIIETFYRPFARNINMDYANGESSDMTKVQVIERLRHAYVLMSYKQNSVNPASFVREIEHTLPKPWSFKIDANTYRARQSFSESTIIETRKGLKMSAGVPQYGVPSWHIFPDVHPHARILYKSVVKGRVQLRTADITRLHFCRQVQLPSTHFNIFTSAFGLPVALYYNRTGKYLFDNEFTEVMAPTDGRMFRICKYDTERESAANGRSKSTSCYWLYIAVCYLIRCFLGVWDHN